MPRPTRTAQRGDWMQTFTGRAFYPMAPDPVDVDPVDIAHALSMICRFGGHSRQFYSVAEHCLLMSETATPANALWLLFHDGAEAYVGDMVRPLKYALPDYRAAEKLIMQAICARLGLDPVCPPEVKEADFRILRTERDALMSAPPHQWTSIENVPALDVTIHCWPPAEAKKRFLARFAELTQLATR